MNDQREILSTGAWGTVLDGQQPPGQLAELDAQHAATPARLAGARALFEEASLDDFDAVGSKGRRWLHRETGIQYVVDESRSCSGIPIRVAVASRTSSTPAGCCS